MIATILTILLILAPSQASNQVPAAQKREFIKLMQQLPFEGEFYTEKAIEKAGTHLPVLFALTEKILRNTTSILS